MEYLESAKQDTFELTLLPEALPEIINSSPGNPVESKILPTISPLLCQHMTKLPFFKASIAVNSRALLNYLNETLKKVNLKEKWQFIEYPSFWSRNSVWLFAASAAAGGGLIGILLNRGGETSPPEPLVGHPEFPR